MNALKGPFGMLMTKPRWASVVALSMGIVPSGVARNMDLIHNHTRRLLPNWAAASSIFGFPGATGIFGDLIRHWRDRDRV
jgi:hypothetical protein